MPASNNHTVKDNGADKILDEAFLIPAGALVLCFQLEWLRRVNKFVPDPYLDEVFHVPQADAYWHGKWSHWDDKITTPPGLYVYSVFISKLAWFDPRQAGSLSPCHLRWTNTLLLYLLAATCAAWLLLAKKTTLAQGLSRTLAIFAFPLFFFFSGLYYTDIFSALSVMITYCFWQASQQRERGLYKVVLQTLHLISGLVALASRQTNIFWVAVYVGGLQAITTIKQKSRIHDPPIAEACFEDFPTMIISLVTQALSSIPQLLFALWPQLSLLASFAAFVFWNGGVVLGDKSNHVAGIHFAQILYLWPFMMFFSWPLVLPRLVDFDRCKRHAPRLWIIGGLMFIMLGIVHFNTVIHPFLLADNRHYTFYTFKALRTTPWKFYAAIPVYVVCAWLSVLALGSGTDSRRVAKDERSNDGKTSKKVISATDQHAETNTLRISFLFVWFLTSALSLVTAPLVEHRYFILPWLMWRLNVPDPEDVLASSEDTTTNSSDIAVLVQNFARVLAKRSVWIEIIWYMAINLVTCGLFLYRGFAWAQEPGNVQRFMW